MLDFFDGYEFKEKEFKLNVAETVLDCEKFVGTHIQILKSNSGKKSVMPYYWRLVKIYEHLKSKEK